MNSHADDLRVEVERDGSSLVAAAGASGTSADGVVQQIVDDWRAAPLTAAAMRLFEHAEKLTLQPSRCSERDIEELRQAGWSDAAIHDAAQVVGYFNYINRIAEGLGVDPEHGSRQWCR